jgi:hypothetical protein
MEYLINTPTLLDISAEIKDLVFNTAKEPEE